MGRSQSSQGDWTMILLPEELEKTLSFSSEAQGH